jgi:hypothetical protein
MNGPIYMPDGRPCTEILFESGLIEFLRLKELSIKNPIGALRYYRERGKLMATWISNCNAYARITACEFLRELTKII